MAIEEQKVSGFNASGDYIGVYYRRHIPSGKETIGQQEFLSYRDFINSIEKWNRSLPEYWQYEAIL